MPARAFLLALLAAVAGLLAVAAGASADALTPESGGSPNADEIDSLYKIVFVVAIVVFVGVEGTLLYSVLRFRARKGRIPAQIHGNTRLEIGWTVGATLVLAVITVITFIQLGKINDPQRSGPGGYAGSGRAVYASVDQPNPPGGEELDIEVNGQQFVWRFSYDIDRDGNTLNDPFTYEEMVVPANTTVTLDIVSQDVAHSWWIPKLGGKMDALPGYTNHTWFKARLKPGQQSTVYEGQCAELCGRNHANMLATVRVLPVPQFKAWLARQTQQIKQANTAAAGQAKALNPLQPTQKPAAPSQTGPEK